MWSRSVYGIFVVKHFKDADVEFRKGTVETEGHDRISF
jgi:hypothetical protein